MLQDATPGARELLLREQVRGYVGFDPTADSLGVGNLVQVMTLLHFQRAGHKPIVLVGGATGLVGDPSGKSQERPLLSEDALAANIQGQRSQLERFLDFDPGPCAAELVNNRDWFKDFHVLGFLREVGKHISVNSMLAKDSVRRRIGGEEPVGMSFAEFSYSLIQAYDFYWLWKHRGVKLQLGGSDQWGNIVTGTELIRRKEGGEAHGLTTLLLTKADGTKFGKTEKGNLWLDAQRTSPYEFFQFWLSASDVDARSYARIFTVRSQEEIVALEAEQATAPERRSMQRAIADEVTARVHGSEGLHLARAATEILFGGGTLEQLRSLDEEQFVALFAGAGVPMADVPRADLAKGISLPELFSDRAKLLGSRSQVHALAKANALAVNFEKIGDAKASIGLERLLNDRYLLLQKGRRDYCLIRAV